MTKFQKFMFLLFTVGMMFVLFSATAMAAPASEITIGSVTLNETTPYMVDGAAAESGTLGEDECTAYYDNSTGTLYLDCYSATLGQGISAVGDLTINLSGSNEIYATDINSIGIEVTDGSLLITGKGNLYLSALLSPIDCARDVTIMDTSVLLYSGTPYGILAVDGNVDIISSVLLIIGG